MCNDRESFYALEELKKPVNVKVGNGEYVKAKVQGKIKVQIKTASKKGRKFELSEVLYVPDMVCTYKEFFVQAPVEYARLSLHVSRSVRSVRFRLLVVRAITESITCSSSVKRRSPPLPWHP